MTNIDLRIAKVNRIIDGNSVGGFVPSIVYRFGKDDCMIDAEGYDLK